MIWLIGDSVFRGAVDKHRRWDNPVTEDMRRAPLWPVRSPAATMNLLAGEEIARFGGKTGHPDKVAERSAQLAEKVVEEIIVAGDTVVFLDVGTHACDPERAQADWLSLRSAVTARGDLRLVMCTAFDNVDPARPPEARIPAQSLMHDRPFGGRSHNDALRAAAAVPLEEAGATELFELGAHMAAIQRQLRAVGSTAYRKDGVHLNYWGQTALSLILFRRLRTGRTPDTEAVSRVLLAGEAGPQPARSLEVVFGYLLEEPAAA